MNYAIVFPEELYSSIYFSGWNLGDVCITSGFAELIENPSSDENLLNNILKSHFNGDYGIINNDFQDLKRANEARAEGRSFTSIFNVNDEFIKVVTNPSIKRTVICLQMED